MTGPTKCRFCEIVRREHAAEIVCEDDHFVAFLDHAPLAPGHTLVVTREHYDNMLAVPPARAAALFTRVHGLSRKLIRALNAEGVLIASNVVVQQTVNHAHMHIVPRWSNDRLEGFSNPGPPKANLSEVATQIRKDFQQS